jgi:hypothetical protein
VPFLRHLWEKVGAVRNPNTLLVLINYAMVLRTLVSIFLYFIIVNNFKTLWCIGKPYYFMKSLLISVVFMLLSGVINAQNTCIGYVQSQTMVKYTESKDGTVSTKTCLSWSACPNMDVIEIKATNSSYITLYKRDESTYMDGNRKTWDRYVDKNGLIVFQCDKKAFYYRP